MRLKKRGPSLPHFPPQSPPHFRNTPLPTCPTVAPPQSRVSPRLTGHALIESLLLSASPSPGGLVAVVHDLPHGPGLRLRTV